MMKNLVGAVIVALAGSACADCFTVTGTMKEDACRGLCQLPDGEIRHYGKDVLNNGARVYASSRDGGRNWTEHLAKTDWEDAMVQSPWSGWWVTLRSLGTDKPSLVIRAKNGPGDPASQTNFVMLSGFVFNRQPVPLASRKRWLCPGNWHGKTADGLVEYCAAVAVSDDDGITWRLVVARPNVKREGIIAPDKMLRWENHCCEPTVLEMKDGSVWMAVRTTLGHHYLYVSHDGGDTWGKPSPMPGFYASNTMPLLFRLKDGRILFFWNNTSPLPTPDPKDHPELGFWELSGQGEAAFTNRDAWHAAISEDEGKTWRGFRELRLLDFGTRADFRQYGMSLGHEVDKSVHQAQAVEREDGLLVLSDGQSPAARRLGIFDPACLYATNRTEDFRDGLVNVATHLFVKSYCGDTRFKGHCCWNRTNGALLVPDPVEYLSKREVLQLCRIPDPRLVSTRQGAVWNFPVARKGRLELVCCVRGDGFRLTLADRWFCPSDEYAAAQSPLSIAVDATTLGAKDRWVTLALNWDAATERAELSVDGRRVAVQPYSLKDFSPYGTSYLHLQTLAEQADEKGSYFRSFAMTKLD